MDSLWLLAILVQHLASPAHPTCLVLDLSDLSYMSSLICQHPQAPGPSGFPEAKADHYGLTARPAATNRERTVVVATPAQADYK